MPRKRTISDEDLLDAALAIVHADGPGALSFASLAAEVGLASSTIVQRFGTKAALLQAALVRAWDHLDAATAAAIARASRDRAGVVDLLGSLSGQYDEDDFADQLIVLREDMRDPVLRARGAAWAARADRSADGPPRPLDRRGRSRPTPASVRCSPRASRAPRG